MKNPKHYLAHVRRNDDGSFEIHYLEEHLRVVTDRLKAIQGCISRHSAV